MSEMYSVIVRNCCWFGCALRPVSGVTTGVETGDDSEEELRLWSVNETIWFISSFGMVSDGDIAK